MSSILLFLLLQAPAAPTDEVVVVRGGTVLTIDGEPVENGVVVIRNGVIEAVGPDLASPAGATEIDARGCVVMPGLIDPYSRVAMTEQGGDPAGNRADVLAAHAFRPVDENLERLTRAGYTLLGVYPAEGALSGRMAVVRTAGRPGDRVIVREGPMRIGVAPRTDVKTTVRDQIQRARDAIAAEAAAQAAAQPPAAGQPAPAAPAQPPDDKTQLFMAILRGQSRMVAEARTSAAFLHLRQVLGDTSGWKWTLAAGTDLWQAADRLSGVAVILPPEITFVPMSRDRVNPARDLERAGARVAFSPENDSVEEHEAIWFRLGLLVRAGLSRNAALEGVTVRAAEALGVEDRFGTIQPGREGDLVLYTADPLSGQARVARVLVHGRTVYEEPAP